MKRAIPHGPIWPGILFSILGGGFLSWAIWLAYQNHLFASYARHTEGIVVRKFVTETYGRHGTVYHHYNFLYEYAVGPLQVERAVEVHGLTWSQYAERDSILITYLPEEPKNSRIDDPSETRATSTQAHWALGIGLATLIFGCGTTAYIVQKNNIRKSLMGSGLQTTGKITSVATENPSGKQVRTFLKLEFSDNRGRLVQGRTWDLSRAEEDAWNEGMPVQVFYSSTNPDQFTVSLDRSK